MEVVDYDNASSMPMSNDLKASDASVIDENAEDADITLSYDDSETANKVVDDVHKSVTKTDVKALKFSIHSILGISGEDSSTQDVLSNSKYSILSRVIREPDFAYAKT